MPVFLSKSRVLGFFVATVVCGMLSGCAMGAGDSASATTGTLQIAGTVHGGQQAVTGATVQLYAANMTTNAGASTAMLTKTVTTDSHGYFSISGDYTCPASNPLVYLVGTGGNPGISGTVNNSDLAMMALLGTCNQLLGGAGSTTIIVNELTTVAAVEALSSFMTDYAHVGSVPTNPNALAGVFENANSMVSSNTGQAASSGYVELPTAVINTLADVLAACVNTVGGASGDTSNCGQLLAKTSSTDTVTAALHMVQSPGTNAAALYGLVTGTPPFQPYLTTVPSDFTASVGYPIPGNSTGAALDSNGRIWIAFGGYNYNTVTDMSTAVQSGIIVYDNNFNQLFTIAPGTGGLYYPTELAADVHGNVYAVNSNNTISEFNSSGSAVSPSAGWSTGIAPSFMTTVAGNGAPYNSNQLSELKVDAQGTIWAMVPYGSTQCYLTMSGGVVTTPSGNFCSMTATQSAEISAVDGSGSAWSDGFASIAKVNSAGNYVVAAPTSQSCFYPESLAFTQPNTSVAIQEFTIGFLYDHVQNQLWGYSQTGAGAITDAGAALFCDVAQTTLPLIPSYASSSTTAGSAYSAGGLLLASGVLDGAGNLWFTSGGLTATGVVGTTAGTFTGTASYASYLSEISPTGKLLTPYNASTSTYGLQPTGLSPTATVNATNAQLQSEQTVGLFGVDVYGNIWAIDELNLKVIKVSGMATANTVNY